LKKLLAYSTLSVLGTLVMLLGIGSELAIKAFFIRGGAVRAGAWQHFW